MFAITRHPRRFAAAVLTLVAWVAASVVVSATSAVAKVGPNDTAASSPRPQTVTVATVDWSQLAITAPGRLPSASPTTFAIRWSSRHGRHTSAVHA